MKKLVCLIMILLAGNVFGALMAPTLDGKLVMGYDGSSANVVWDAVGNVWRVTSLLDQVGSYNANAPTEARRPILAQMETGNGLHSVVDFDGSNDYLMTSVFSTPLDQSISIFVVAARDTSASSYLVDGQNSTNAFKVGTTSQNRYAMGAGKDVISGFYANVGVFEVYSALFQSSSGGNSRLYVSDALGTTQVLLGDVGTNAMNALTLGRWAGGGGYLNGQIAEVLVYDGNISGADVTSVQQYLLNKYIVPEPATILILTAGVIGLIRRK